MEGRNPRLNDLPEHILLHILSMLPDGKEVVRSSILSTRWRYLWKSVPLSLDFYHFADSQKQNADSVASTTRELYYWRSCQNIRAIKFRLPPKCEKHKDVDLWVHFATQVATVESFTLEIGDYEFPQFAYKNTSIRRLVLQYCKLNPSNSVNWTSLVYLSVKFVKLTEGVIEKVLSGCPNLESVKIDLCRGFQHMKISSVRLRELILTTWNNWDHAVSVEILAPYLQNLQLSGFFHEIHLKNVASLATVVLRLDFSFNDDKDWLEEELIKLKGLLQGFAHVENLELGPWCIECLSILELKGWQLPPSAWKSLKLNTALERLDLPGICSFLQSSLDVETLVIDWYKHEPRYRLPKYTNEDEQNRKFKMQNLNCSLLHLKTIKIINFLGPLSKNKSILPLAKYLLGNAEVLEKFIIITRSNAIGVYRDYPKIEEKLLSFPRSSTCTSVVFSY